MTCLHPDACRKKPDPRQRSALCKSCAQSIANVMRAIKQPRRGRPSPQRVVALQALPEDRHAEFNRLVDVKDYTIAEARRMIEDDLAVQARRAGRREA